MNEKMIEATKAVSSILNIGIPHPNDVIIDMLEVLRKYYIRTLEFGSDDYEKITDYITQVIDAYIMFKHDGTPIFTSEGITERQGKKVVK